MSSIRHENFMETMSCWHTFWPFFDYKPQKVTENVIKTLMWILWSARQLAISENILLATQGTGLN